MPGTDAAASRGPAHDREVGSGERADFYADPSVDRLIEVSMELAAELWVARRRQARLERLLASRGLLEPEELERGEPPGTDDERQRAARDEFVARVFAPLTR